MSEGAEPGPCGACGHDPACGYAQVNEVWYCHPDENCHDRPFTCFEMELSPKVPVWLDHRGYAPDPPENT